MIWLADVRHDLANVWRAGVAIVRDLAGLPGAALFTLRVKVARFLGVSALLAAGMARGFEERGCAREAQAWARAAARLMAVGRRVAGIPPKVGASC